MFVVKDHNQNSEGAKMDLLQENGSHHQLLYFVLNRKRLTAMNMCPFITLLQEDGCIVCIVFSLVLSIPSLVLMSKVGACNSIHVGFSKTCVVDLFLTGTVKLCRGRGF